MSIFDAVARAIGGGSNSSKFDEVNHRTSAHSGTSSPFNIGGFSPAGAASGLLKTAVGKFAPSMSGALSKALSGDYLGAGLNALGHTGIGKSINDALTGRTATSLLYESMDLPLLGGITPFEARQILQDIQSTNYARKNLFFLEILDFFPGDGGAQGQSSGLFNLFATNVSFGPCTASGEAVNIGSAQMDNVHGSERVEMRITTLDDAYGSIQRWFETRFDGLAHNDGTFGVPADYLVQVRLLQAAVNDRVMQRFGGLERKWVMRPSQLELELDRADQQLQQVQLSFTQFDTFMYNP
ncbi:hypothetical protein [Burkholderia ubonensis]|uniref:Uncharacterized protein n=1 Tax=Burkholderia ubonensis TaxID=101571 RepID=A0ABD4DZU3_9BURK|nr:hypothetical protein [Burkholderia ubonensis]KVN83503.1 hypothetical protein WJ68_16460 [Burkholderia ubonensis]